MNRLHNVFCALTVGVAYKYLSKGFLIDQTHDLRNTRFVKLVKNIIQQQYRGSFTQFL